MALVGQILLQDQIHLGEKSKHHNQARLDQGIIPTAIVVHPELIHPEVAAVHLEAWALPLDHLLAVEEEEDKNNINF